MKEVMCKLCVLMLTAVGTMHQLRAEESEPPVVSLIPWPAELQVESGTLTLTAESRIVYANKELGPLANVLRQELYQITGTKLAVAAEPAQPGDILLKFDPSLRGETHTVVVDDRVEIAGADYQNTAMASTSLLQSLQGEQYLELRRMALKDTPHSGYRSLMIDVARRPHTVDTLQQCILLCRLYKVRTLQLHLNDDQSFAFECRAFPQLATPGHHFSRTELKELVAFADARGVTLVPELDAPGHTTAMRRAMPELFGPPNLYVVNLGNEEVFVALEKIAAELCEIFHSSPYFHIGADEAYFGALAKHEQAKQAIADKSYHDVHDLFYEYIVRMHRFLKSQGKQTVMWESFRGTGSPRVEIPRDILVMAWETLYQLPQSLLDKGYDIVNVSWKPSYLTPGWRWDPEYIYGWNLFRWENHWQVAPSYIPIQLEPYPSQRIRGGMMCSWESTDEMQIPGLRLRLPPWLERIWSPRSKTSYDHFHERFVKTDQIFQRLISPVEISATGLTDPEYLGPFYNRENWFGSQLKITLKSFLPNARIRYTLDGTTPTLNSPRYEAPLTINASTTLRTQLYDPQDQQIGGITTVPYEHRPITGKVDGLLMQVPHDPGRGRYRTKFDEQVAVTLQCAMSEGSLRYTTNGQPPNVQSTIYAEPIVLKKSGVISAQYFNEQGKPIGKPWRRSFEHVNAETNLTTGKPVTASAVASNRNLPELVVDGIVDKNFHWDAGGAPQWLQIDLEESHKLNSVQIFPYWDGRRYYQYRVDVSLDGKTWNEVVDHSQNKQPATAKGVVHRFDPLIARYLRVTMLHNSANPGLHLVEVRAFTGK